MSPKIIGASLDISFGQLVDRLGVKIGLGFPCGAELEGIAQKGKRLNIKIPRTASKQWAEIPGKVTVPRPGDLIAFSNVEEGGVYHIGIYIGDDKMIHAPKPGDVVRISNLDWWFRNGRVQGFLRPYSDSKRQPIYSPH